jgi:P4 family phage/plasmid primase-like protien
MITTTLKATELTFDRAEQLERYPLERLSLIPLHKPDATRTHPNGKTVPMGKAPRDRNWTTRLYNGHETIAEALKSGRNVGVRIPKDVIVVDVDPRNGGEEGWRNLCAKVGIDADKYPTVITGSGGLHVYMRNPRGLLVRDTLENEDFKGVEFKSKGRQVVAAGSTHPNGEPYLWDESKAAIDDPKGIEDAPPALLTLIKRTERTGTGGEGGGEYTPAQIADMLATMKPEDFREESKWRKLAMACHHASLGDARYEFIAWSTLDPEFENDADVIGRRWDSFDALKTENVVTAKSLMQFVHKHGDPSSIPRQGVGTDFDTPVDDHDWLEGGSTGDESIFTPHEKNPFLSAKEFRRRFHPTLIRHNDDWLEWNGSHYVALEDATMLSRLWKFLETGFNPNKNSVANVEAALKADAHVAIGTYDPPCWLDGNGPFAAKETLAFKDGLLHLPTMQFIPPTPNFFTRNALTYGFDANAAKPRQFFKFLLSSFKGSRKSIGILQEIFGYMLLPDTAQQKAFLWDGPPRGGKGTTIRVLQKLIGEHNCASPTVSGLGNDAILESMIGKQLAIISDMRIDKKTPLGAVSEKLLAITGEDSVTFNRKYKTAWTGKLLVRFFILTNLPPNIPDVSNALPNRFIILKSFESFLGREDTGLESRLLAELPGILLWAIAGWRRLQARGRFVQSPEGETVLRRMIDQASPVSAFVRECCIFDPDAITSKDDLYKTYMDWEDDGRPLTDSIFARNLRASSGGRIKETRPRRAGDRIRSWNGIRLNPVFEVDRWADESPN